MKKIFLLLFLATATAFGQKPIFTSAKVKAATVYFNSAEISQSAAVTLPAGTSEVVIKNVANYLLENTLQVGVPSNVTILSSQFTNNYISEFETDENSPALKKVRDSIKLVEEQIALVYNQKTSEQKTLELLDKNNQVYGQQSGLSVTELMKMVDYYKTKRTETANTINTLTTKEQKLNEKLTDLKSKLEVNISKEEKISTGKLVLQIMSETALSTQLDISYLTQGASWQPFYDLRADDITSPINMLYKAQVVQQTGIDWKKVKLTLSSGMPNQSSFAPELSPWFLRFENRQYDSLAYGNTNNVAIIGAASQELSDVVVEAYRTTTKAKSNVAATITEHQMNVSFDIDLPYDIASNGKQHSVTLKEIKLPATYRHFSVPKLEQEAFLLAEISDYAKYNMLRGEANIIFEGMYIGKTQINPSQTADTLNLSMGRDKKISVKRETVAEKSSTKFLSSGKEQVFTYDIIIRNNKKEAAKLTLKDQYPVSTDKEIEVELLQSDSAKVDKETGILTWEMSLKPTETKKVRISYKVKSPKSKTLANL
ncbi:DUF4139 domain-containing protein [Flavobacterium sp. AG291]|uniref:DUF4139 domain-containing protein n=1 Tax=Flavobacterium sp. AG291 TaxID=2184000 RepID=UPI000E0C7AF7|nr:DUF4139 domain-containing protein [Flavobacterium sp. AG291]RDI08573.1 uncharacterized protein (TIGR02231 family) [Flavobacterium sp. AG291]